jgi:hypothetical protein
MPRGWRTVTPKVLRFISSLPGLLVSSGLSDAEKPGTAAPTHNGHALPGAAINGANLPVGRLPIPTTDGALYLANEVIYGEAWAARHNAEIWGVALRREDKIMTTELSDQTIAPSVDQTFRRITVRGPRVEDIGGIVAVVRTCDPFLTAHNSYIYWMTIRCHGDICAVVESDGELVAWCSVARVSGDKYFSHQTAVAPGCRGHGVGKALWAYVLDKIGHSPAFELEFTIDRNNDAALGLMASVADQAGMRLVKKPGAVPLLEAGCVEELYVMRSSMGVGHSGREWCSDAAGFYE